ncbi:MAG: hypothetical protein Q8928_09120 [Bacteroidota bacterium]|nr:hypothetical protein [Bacteroidota bacterium]
MKKLLFFLLLSGTLMNVAGQADFEARERVRMAKNKVKSQIQWSYDYVNGKPGTKGYKSAATTFDRNGNIIEVVNYKKDGGITSILVYTYNARGEKTSYSRYQGNKEKLTFNQNIRYDERGNKILENGFDGVSNFVNTFVYVNNQLSEIKYTTDKRLVERRIFKNTGNKTEMTVLGPTGNVLSKEVTEYDGKRNATEIVNYQQNDIAQKEIYKYDNEGKKLEESKQKSGSVNRRKYTYDGDDIIRITEERSGEKPLVAYQYKYDSRGNVLEEKWTKNGGDPSRKVHKYDSRGLLIETDSYNATYDFSVLYKFQYEFY